MWATTVTIFSNLYHTEIQIYQVECHIFYQANTDSTLIFIKYAY